MSGQLGGRAGKSVTARIMPTVSNSSSTRRTQSTRADRERVRQQRRNDLLRPPNHAGECAVQTLSDIRPTSGSATGVPPVSTSTVYRAPTPPQPRLPQSRPRLAQLLVASSSKRPSRTRRDQPSSFGFTNGRRLSKRVEPAPHMTRTNYVSARIQTARAATRPKAANKSRNPASGIHPHDRYRTWSGAAA